MPKMKTYAKLERFPLGAIHPLGFLRDQCERLRDGIGGHLYELEPGMIRDPFIHKTYVPAWGSGDQSGWGAEISGNYWTGYIQLAYTLNDPEMIKTTEWWVNTMLQNQRPDGYLGTFYEEDADIYDDYNAWGTACMMRGLIAFYERTMRDDVLEAVHRCLIWFTEHWAGEHKTSYAAPYIIEPLVFVWKYTGDDRLIAFAEEFQDYLVRHDIFLKSYRSMFRPFRYYADHTAGVGNSVRLPALLYAATGNAEYLRATETMIEKVRRHSNHLSGSPVSVTEYLGPVGSTTETEYCSYAYYNEAYTYLSAITGKAAYGDYMEELFYNGAQGARKKDERAIAYLSAPNQVYATNASSTGSNCVDMQVYAPCYPVACCPVNAVAVVPEFIRGMFLRDGDDIYAACYGPCTLNYDGISVTEEALYPFRNTVTFTLSLRRECGFFLKYPAWAKGMTVTVNGETVSVTADENGYCALRRVWSEKDTVTVTFAAEVAVIHVNDRDCANKQPIAFKYGALLFSYHIPENWCPIAGNPMTPLPEGWSWYNANPTYTESDTADPHDRIGLRRLNYTWNVAVDEAIAPSDVTVEELTEDGYVWENPPIALHLTAWKAPWASPTYPTRTFEPFGEKQLVTEPVSLTLVPYGATNLRITYFPRADLDHIGE